LDGDSTDLTDLAALETRDSQIIVLPGSQKSSATLCDPLRSSATLCDPLRPSAVSLLFAVTSTARTAEDAEDAEDIKVLESRRTSRNPEREATETR
jgi:hypothetical protein